MASELLLIITEFHFSFIAGNTFDRLYKAGINQILRDHNIICQRNNPLLRCKQSGLSCKISLNSFVHMIHHSAGLSTYDRRHHKDIFQFISIHVHHRSSIIICWEQHRSYFFP